MKTYIVLLRGINVGGKNMLPMKELVSLLEENDFHNVRTYIQSGNVVLQSKKNPKVALGNLIVGRFGFDPEVLAMEKTAFDSSIRNNPFNATEGKTIHFYFCSKVPKLNQGKLDALIAESEDYLLQGNVFYLFAPAGIGRSKLVANLEACLGAPVTGRNLNTINKITQMMDNV